MASSIRNAIASNARAAAKARSGAASRSLVILIAALLFAFVGSLALQVDAQRRTALNETINMRRQAAAVAAEQANTAMVHAWGALAGAAEVARSDGLLARAPGSIAHAATRARPVTGAVIFDAAGRTLAATSDADVALADAARRATGSAQTWAGVAEAHGKRAPALSRRVGDAVIVSLLDPRKLLPEATSTVAQVFLVRADGAILAASPANALAPGDTLKRLFGTSANLNLDGFIGANAHRETVAIGVARVSTGDLRILSAAPARSPLMEMLRATVRNVLLAAAPILAVGALLLLLRQNVERAKEAEEEVVRVERRYRTAADGARASIFEWNPSSGVLLLSESLAALLRAPGVQIGLPQLVLLAGPEERAGIEESFERARETGALDVSFRVANAHAGVWVEMRGLAIEDPESGDGVIIGTALDVTPRRDAELRARALQRRLREAIDSFTGPFALWDSRRRLVLWNRTFQQLFDLAPPVLRAGAPYDAISMACARQIRRERLDKTDTQMREVELANGSWYQIQERRTMEGGLLTIGLDITTIKRQEEALTQSETTLKAAVAKLERSEGRNKELARSFEEQKRRAEDASSAKSAFLANMSHELRTPLNAVIGFSEIMAQGLFGPLGDHRYQQYAKDILASGQLLLDLINDILDMAKIEAGKFNLAPRALDPLDAIEQAVRLVKRRAEEKGLQVIVDAPDLPEIEADHRAVKQMLLNLMSNAVKFTDKGGIMVEGRATEKHLQLRVIDTGRGIAREHLPRLARPFEQVDNELARDHPGTGLGLALTKSLAEMHGGRLEIESQQGKGTVVSIILPRKFGGDTGGAPTKDGQRAAERPIAAE